ncbi:MAG: hypothetical protein ACREC6_13850, partial [Hyphomicrobiaceae bacterium]
PDPYTHFAGRPQQAALDSYSYAAFLKNVEFTDFAKIEYHGRRLDRIEASLGKFFMARLTDEFVRLYPVTDDRIDAKISIGEAYLDRSKAKPVYRIVGYHILSSVARHMEANIKAGRMSAGDARTAPLIKRLEKHKVYLALQPSRVQKFVQRFNDCIADKRRCLYLWHRFQNYVGDLARRTGLKSGGDGNRYVLTEQTGSYAGAPGRGRPVHVFKLTRRGEPVGHVVWMQQPPLRAMFLTKRAGSSAYQAFRAAQQGKEMRRAVAAMTGAYTSAGLPDGLTAHRGHIVNSVVLPGRDGLVLFAPDGSIEVVNLKAANSQLCNKTLNVRQNLVDLVHLVECIREKQYTAFQTHLLAHANTPLMALGQGKPEERERRALAIARRGTERHHILFDLPKPHDLAELLHAVFRTLEFRKLTVEAILNLDTGAYNILQVHGEDGRILTDPRGSVDIEKATNLIVYFLN